MHVQCQKETGKKGALTHEQNGVLRNPALVHLIVGGLPNQFCHPGRSHALARPFVTASCGDEACAAVN